MKAIRLKNSAEKKEKITIKIQPSLLHAIKIEASRRGISYNALIRQLLLEKLGR